MVLYNVTVKVSPFIEKTWLTWMQEVHVQNVMKTGFFLKYKICRLLYLDETDGITYAFQYFCKDMEQFKEYQEKHAKRLQKVHKERYKDQYVSFRTIMEVLEEGWGNANPS